MKKKITSTEFLKIFRETCEKYNKMYIPDSPREDAIAVSLMTYHKKNYDIDTLVEALDMYVKELGHKPALLLEFSLVVHDYRQRAIQERRLREEYKHVLKMTEELMKGRD